ncbi:MAG: response regulator [Verrucomicrobiae bacterium]|nr:response regulator [Verrucomicrobiae bacterium]
MSHLPTQLPPVVEILLVEDNPRDAELTQRALRQHRVVNELVWVRDGAEALAYLFGASGDPTAHLNRVPRLILLDLKLPKVDGHEVLAQIKADPRTKGIPVVILTSSREESDLHRAYQSGTNSYIVKPVDFDGFVEAVRQLGFYWMLLNQLPASSSSSTPPAP